MHKFVLTCDRCGATEQFSVEDEFPCEPEGVALIELLNPYTFMRKRGWYFAEIPVIEKTDNGIRVADKTYELCPDCKKGYTNVNEEANELKRVWLESGANGNGKSSAEKMVGDLDARKGR